MMKKIYVKIALSVSVSLFSLSALAQQSVGIGTTTPNTKSILELSSTTQGFLLPRMTTAQRVGIGGLGAAEKGLLVYDNSLNTIYQWDGTAWVALGGADNLGNHTATTNLQMAGFRINSTGTHTFSISGLDVMSILSGSNAISALQGQFRALSGTTVTTPAYAFNTSTTTGMSNPVANELTLVTNGAERMRLSSTGNIGINNSTPTERLDVTGNVRFSGALMPNNLAGTAGQFLRSNGPGVAPTWVTAVGEATTASNGLTLTGTDVRLGGTLLSNTTVTQAGFSMNFTGGNVGIGTTTPLSPLQLGNFTGIIPFDFGGGSNYSIFTYNAYPNAGSLYSMNNSSVGFMYMGNDGGGNTPEWGIMLYNPMAANTNFLGSSADLRINLRAKGFGIFVDSPGAAIEMASLDSAAIVMRNAQNGDAPTIYFTSPATGNWVGIRPHISSNTYTLKLPSGLPSTAGQVLSSDLSGNLSWANASASGWGLTGNAGTTAGTNFLGTTDDIALVFKTNGQTAGYISNSTGSLTTFGYQAGNVNTGANNTFIGRRAGLTNTTGVNNTALGMDALSSSVMSNNNTAIGLNAMRNNTYGGRNTAVGKDALNAQSFSNANISYNSDNVAIGFQSLMNNQPTASSNGNQNTALGNFAGDFNATGASNTFIGYNADATVNNLINATAIGANATVGVSNTVQLGSNADVRFDRALLPGGAAGTAGQVLTSAGPGLVPTWSTPAGGLPAGAINQTLHHNGTNWISNSFLLNTGTSVGIGIPSPVTSLHVGASSVNDAVVFQYAGASVGATGFSNVRSRGTLTTPAPVLSGDRLGHYGFNGFNGVDFGQPVAEMYARATQNYTGSAQGTSLHFGTTQNGSLAPSERMMIDQNGSIGIGTSTPASDLHLFSVAGARIVLDGNGASASGNPRIDFTTAGNSSATSFVGTGGVNGWQMRAYTSGFSPIARQNDFQIRFYNGSTFTDVMYFDNTGNVGIGTLNPTETLDIVGNLKFSGALMPNNLAGTAGQILTSAGPGVAPTWTNAATGTVTSVALTAPGIFTVTGSPITTSGSLGLTLTSQAANTVFAAPNGSVGAPSFRNLVANDIPSLDASKITTGILPLARGGTNAGLTATNGGVVYSTATAMAITAAGTSGQVLTSNGAAAPTWTSIGTLSGGTTNYLPKWSSATSLSSTSLVYDNGTNVGIGTTTPGEKLQVVNNTLATDNSSVSILAGTTGAATYYMGTSVNPYMAAVRYDNSNNSMSFWTNNTADRMVITNGGNIGIGTSTPATKIHSRGDLQIESTSSSSGVIFNMATLSDGATSVNATGTKGWQWLAYGDAYATTALQNDMRLTFYSGTGTSPFLYFDNAGKLGINLPNATDVPVYDLDVAGTIRTGYNGRNGFLRIYSEQGATDFEVILRTNAAMTQNTTYRFPANDGNASDVLTSDGNGNLSWNSAASLANAWSLTGNPGLTDATNFIGTTDNVPFNIRVDNFKSGRIDNVYNETSFGYLALQNNVTGSGLSNTALGAYALQYNSTGDFNIGIGVSSLINNTGGSENIAIGTNTLRTNIAGSYAVAIGNNAMYNANNSATAYSNFSVAVGYAALYGSGNPALNTGNTNTAIGSYSLTSNQGGSDNVSIGYYTMGTNQSGVSNVAAGNYALYSNSTGANNSAIGFSSLYLNTTGSQNTAMGYYSLYNITTGGQNTSVGSYSFYSNVAGTNGTAIGYMSQYYANNTTTSWINSNVSVGYQAMRGSATAASNTGVGNTAVGYQSMLVLSSGGNNSAFGNLALRNTSTGTNNTGIGQAAGQNNTTGSNNTFIGVEADASPGTLTNATAIGSYAYVTTSNSMVLGSISGLNGATANTNVGIGTSSPVNRLDVEGGVAIGATYSGTNTAPANGLLVEGNVGIGTAAPSHKLHMQVTSGYLGIECTTAGSTPYGIRMYSPDHNWYLLMSPGGAQPGAFSIYDGTTSRYMFYIDPVTDYIGIFDNTPQYPLDVSSTTASYAGRFKNTGTAGADGLRVEVTTVATGTGTRFGTSTTVSGGLSSQYGVYGTVSGGTTNYAVYGSAGGGSTNNYSGYFTGTGDVYVANQLGIGTTAPGYALHVTTNSAAKPTTNTWTVISDARLKKDVKKYEGGIAELMKINPVWFTYTGEAGTPNETGVGVLAQDIQKIAPYMVSEWTYKPTKKVINSQGAEEILPDGEEQKYLGVDNGAMTYMLINATKEQQKEIDDLKAENAKLKADLELIKKQLGIK